MIEINKNLLSLIKESKNTVIYLTDDVARKSGVPNYKEPHGSDLEPWQGINNSRLLTFDFLLANPVLFYKWSKDVWYNMDKYKPNNIHHFVYFLQKKGLAKQVFSEDIARICEKANIENTIELNGNTSSFCLKCGKYFSYDITSNYVNNGEVPYCDRCGTILKSNVLLDEMRINKKDLIKWKSIINHSNLILLFGNPRGREEYKDLLNNMNDSKLVIFSKDYTEFDIKALFKIRDIENCLSFLQKEL